MTRTASKPKTKRTPKSGEKASFASLRTSIDLTQTEFSKLIPISVRSLAGIESGTAPS